MWDVGAFLAIDLIADLTVARSPDMLQNSTNRKYNVARKANFRRMGLAIQWPEAFLNDIFPSRKLGEILFPSVARLGKEWHMLLSSWITARVTELRADEKVNQKDTDMIVPIMRYKDPETGKGLTDADMAAELTTLLIAGSGTMTTGMTSILWYLSRDFRVYDKAVKEVRTTFNTPDDIRIGSRLNSCTYLKACLQECKQINGQGPTNV
jgi:cytochrome P450